MKGGYQLVDLKNVNLVVGADAVKIDGVYKTLEGNYSRATMLTNMVLGGIKKPNRWVNFGLEGTSYHASVGLNTSSAVLYITVTADDMISVSEV